MYVRVRYVTCKKDQKSMYKQTAFFFCYAPLIIDICCLLEITQKCTILTTTITKVLQTYSTVVSCQALYVCTQAYIKCLQKHIKLSKYTKQQNSANVAVVSTSLMRGTKLLVGTVRLCFFTSAAHCNKLRPW